MRTSTIIVQRGSSSKAGSSWKARVTATQQATIESVASTISATVNLDRLTDYVNTGDISRLDGETHRLLQKVVDQCKARSANESQAKRYWPRKVAAVILDQIS